MENKEYTTLGQSEKLSRLGLTDENATRWYMDGLLTADTGMMCPFCGQPLVWDSDSELDPEQVEGFEVVSYYHCKVCCSDFEIYQPTEEYRQKNFDVGKVVPCWGIAGLLSELSKFRKVSVYLESSGFVVRTNDLVEHKSEELIDALYDALVDILKKEHAEGDSESQRQ